MPTFTTLKSRVVPLLINDIDTDQIIPARFLKVTDKAGLGANLFADWRAGRAGKGEFVLDNPAYRGAGILLTGSNFGCGSSREHAPWALMGAGFRAIISTSFADIFRNNALKNGLLPVAVRPEDHTAITERLTDDPVAEITIDLASQTISVPGLRDISFPIEGFSKRCLLGGIDELGYLLQFITTIDAFERATGRVS